MSVTTQTERTLDDFIIEHITDYDVELDEKYFPELGEPIKYPKGKRGTFMFKNMPTSYVEYGNPDATQTIVLVHGYGANAEYWRAIYPELSEGSRVIGIDMLGFGDSFKPTNFEMSIDLWT